jgi:hypothetical protein
MSDAKSENNDSDSDDVEMSDVREVDNHNAPEQIMNDLDTITKAKAKDREALDEMKREYPYFFDDNTDEEGLNQLEEYLENEFEGELKRSEIEAEVLEKNHEADKFEKIAKSLEEQAENATDPLRKESIMNEAEKFRKVGEAFKKEADDLDAKAKGTISKNNNDDDDGNNSSGGPGPSAPFGPSGSDSGPSSNSSGGNFSKIWIILGPIFETIAKVLEDIGNYM